MAARPLHELAHPIYHKDAPILPILAHSLQTALLAALCKKDLMLVHTEASAAPPATADVELDAYGRCCAARSPHGPQVE